MAWQLKWSLLAVVLAACGPSTGDGGDGDGGSDGPTGADGSGVTSGGPGSAGSGSADSATTTAGGSTCEELVTSATPGATVTFTATATGTDPIWTNAGGCGGGLVIQLTDATGQEVIWNDGSECFPVSCADFIDQGTCEVGCNDCAPPNAMRFGAGASATATWQGVAFSSHQLPGECGQFQGCAQQCLRADEIPPGEYTAAITVYATCEGECECDVPGQTPCPLFSEATLSGPSTVEVTFSYPADTDVAIAL